MGRAAEVEDLLRRNAPQVLGALVRRYGHFDAAEDAVQEALLAAADQWPTAGVPDNPRGWLIKVASRRLTDALRSEEARRAREERVAALTPRDAFTAPPPGVDRAPREDDTLTLLFLCCHPDLTPPAQIALTLRAVGGLTTAEIARAYLVPETTMAQRISRAKQKVRGVRFGRPESWQNRLPAVLHTLYLIFNEGYTATSGAVLQRRELAGEAIRLTRTVHRLLPDDGEVAGLLALMLLTDARRAARTGPHGELVPLDEQDRDRWDKAAIEEGVALVTRALSRAARAPTRCAPPSPPYTTSRRPRRRPTGRRSSVCTRCWSAWSRVPSNASTAPWPSPWWTVRRQGSPNSTCWNRSWDTASTRSAATSWSARAPTNKPAARTSPRQRRP